MKRLYGVLKSYATGTLIIVAYILVRYIIGWDEQFNWGALFNFLAIVYLGITVLEIYRPGTKKK